MNRRWQTLQQQLDYRFAQLKLLEQALTHRSFAAEHNERLEFLGDSLLNCVIAEFLYQRFPDLREGELSRLRANLVCQDSLFHIADRLALGEAIRLGEGELKSGGAGRPSILADALEAVLAAVYLDSGFAALRQIVMRLFASALDNLQPGNRNKDAKSVLQEWLQGHKMSLPDYLTLNVYGEAHAQVFEVQCSVVALALQTTGKGSSRRAAEQAAAAQMLQQIGQADD